MRTFLRVFLILLVVGVVAAAAVGGVMARSAMRGPLNTLDGSFTHPSLDAEVTITRDDWGVPHIDAETAHDAYFAYGFAVAQDRLFQLEILRRLGRGELSAILGPATLSADKLSRTMLWLKTAERLLADRDEFDDDFNETMDAFLEGLNYYIETQPLPVEFTILGIEPTSFEPADTLSIMGYMAYGFADGVKSDSIFAIVKQRHPGADAAALFPGYAYDSPVTVMEGVIEADNRQAAAEGLRKSVVAATEARMSGDGYRIDAERLAKVLDEVAASFDLFGGFRGSNSWVLGPSRTKSGGTILANDPHIGFSNPAVWYECHMKYPGYENYGVHLPVIPFPVIGHNGTRAWSMTMFTNDDLDLYAETFNPENPDEVMYRGEWAPVERWTETIEVAGQEAEELEIVVTPHGPIVTGLVKDYDGAPLAASWLFHDIDVDSMQSFYRLAQSTNIDEARAAAADLMAPGINISYADKDGNIAWWAAARLAIRPGHVNAKDVLDGASGKDEVLGYLPFEANPQLENPANGIIVTSNNMSTTGPVGSIAALPGYWQPTDRAGRIHDLLATQDTWSLEELKPVQTDSSLRSAAELVPIMIGLLDEDTVSTFQGPAREAYGAIAAWDYDHDIDSVGATVFQYWYDTLQKRLAMDEIGEANFGTYKSIADSKQMVKAALRDLSYPVWDDVTTEEKEKPAEVTLGAFMEAVDELQAELGPTFEDWRWGNVHTVTYEHILGNVQPLDRLWNIGPLPAPGTEESVAKMAWGTDRYAVTSGASMRKLIDYARYEEPGGAQFILPTGNSGNVMSPHFRDQAEMYLRGEYRDLYVTDEAIAAHTESVTTLRPEI